MYSTYDDALSRTNAWNCTYNYGTVFPGDCNPLGTRKDQGGQLESSWNYQGKRDIGWYVDAPGIFIPASERTFGGLTSFISQDIGDVGVTGTGSFDVSTNGITFIRGAGGEMSWASDNMHFVSHQVPGGNMTLTVRIEAFESTRQSWAMGCLMIRKSLSRTSASYELCLTGGQGFNQQFRAADNTAKVYSYSGSSVANCWLKIVKRGDDYFSYLSFDSLNWNPFGISRNLPNMTSSSYYVGFAVYSRQVGYLAEATISNYSYIPVSSRLTVVANDAR
jgi:hypothetical protein